MRFAGQQGLHNFMGNIPDITMMTNESLEGRSLERQTNHAAESQVAGTGLAAQAKVKEAEYMAEATKAQGQADGMASIAGGIGSLASGIGSGISARPSASPAPKLNLPSFNYW